MTLRIHRLGALALTTSLLLGLFAFVGAPTAAASTQTTMSATVLKLINHDRAAIGLRALRYDSRLVSLANDRAGWMAGTGDMTHSSAYGDVNAAVHAVGVAAWFDGEAIGETNATWGVVAAQYLYGLWRSSPEHWGLIASTRFNYLGIGFAYRPSGHETFGSIVFAEEPDISRPVASMTGAGLSGHTAYWTWTGRDGILATHTAGLENFDVEYRVDNRPWKMLWSGVTRTVLILQGRPSGHTYTLRVRSRDWNGNVGPWSSTRSVRVP